MLAAVREVFASKRTRGLEWRLAQLRGIEQLLTDCEPQIAQALAADLDRNPVETFIGDIATSKGEAGYARRHLKRWMRRRRRSLPLSQLPASGWVQYEPLGVVLVIGAWNYPVNLVLAPLIAAIAAGNCAVVKPSELAPATSALLRELLPKYVDPEAVVVVEGDGGRTQELLSLGFDHILFTGGTETGRKVMAAAAATLTPVTLELGGKNPVIVMADADLDVAARRIALVKLLNSGQTCIAPDYLLVERSIRDELVWRIAAALAEFRADQPDRGLRVVDQRQFDRLEGYLKATKGTVVAGGKTDPAGLRVQPTVIVDPDPDEPVMNAEVFGPILPVLTIDSVDDAVRFVNARPKPLSLYIFSSSRAVRTRLLDEVPAGGVVINHVAMHHLVPQLPFGGVGASGMGSYHGVWGFQTLSHRKAVLAKTFRPDLRLIYPPYTERSVKWLRRLL